MKEAWRGLMFVVAGALSAMKWHSFSWAFLHGLLGELYILYYLVHYGMPK